MLVVWHVVGMTRALENLSRVSFGCQVEWCCFFVNLVVRLEFLEFPELLDFLERSFKTASSFCLMKIHADGSVENQKILKIARHLPITFINGCTANHQSEASMIVTEEMPELASSKFQSANSNRQAFSSGWPFTSDDTFEAILEPLDSLLLIDSMRSTNSGLASPSLRNTLARSGPIESAGSILENPDLHAAVKVHAVDTDGWVVFDAQINVFADTEAKVARFRKVPPFQLVFLDLKSTLQDLFSFGPSDCNMDCDLFISTNTK